jgi:hypothetical protein
MPSNMVLTGAGLLLVALSLGKIADAVGQMGGMSITQIAKGLGTLAGSLLILAVALNAMSGSIGGAVALGVAAAGLALLAPALVLMGRQSWGEIIKGLVTLAGAPGYSGSRRSRSITNNPSPARPRSCACPYRWRSCSGGRWHCTDWSRS